MPGAHGLKQVRLLPGGRILASSPRGDLYYLVDGATREKRRISLVEAIRLLRLPAAPPDPPPDPPRGPRTAQRKPRLKRTKSAISMSRREIQEAATWLVAADPHGSGELCRSRAELQGEIERKAEEIENLLAHSDESRHQREFTITFYRQVARLYRAWRLERRAEGGTTP